MSVEPELETLIESQILVDDHAKSDEDDSAIDLSSSPMNPNYLLPMQPRSVQRTFSMGQRIRRPSKMGDDRIAPGRRMSHDAESIEKPLQRKFIVDVEPTIERLLAQEDTDGNNQISITDRGPKSVTLGTLASNGYKGVEVRGNYMISSLLQELAIAKDRGEERVVIEEARLAENPVNRLSRMIREIFWDNLTRTIDADGLERILTDTKGSSLSTDQLIYVPKAEAEMLEYYKRVAIERPNLRLRVETLPEVITPEYMLSLNDKPGLLAIAMRRRPDPEKGGIVDMEGIPFVVPGARFNELYNWDSYFIALGLIEDNRLDLASGPIEHFIFEIKHYGKILNGNRTYYLLRSQPPFLTDYAIRVYKKEKQNLASLSEPDHPREQRNKDLLRRAITAAIKEYHCVWMNKPRYEPGTGLSRYYAEGLGVTPETERSHFNFILKPYADKYGCSIKEFRRMYDHQQVHEPELDEYFVHDRAVRESGHDTSYRLERRCANLATVDLNSLLYKYEMDIGRMIKEEFNDSLEIEEDYPLHAPWPPGSAPSDNPRHSTAAPQRSQEWFDRAEFRKQQVNKYCWNEVEGMFFDYDFVLKEQILYESVTTFWTMWAGLASDLQAHRMVTGSLSKFEEVGGLVPCTEESRGPISVTRPNRQWDYPFAWPPHQILTWEGLKNYGFMNDARRLVYRWLYMQTSAFVDFNGVVPEKFDAVALSHLVSAEYGNQGTEFSFVPREGFGWMNASYQVGLTYLTSHMRKAIAALQHPEDFFAAQRGWPIESGHIRRRSSTPSLVIE
ncbi:alpha,alpha-trehalase [Malassezia psittaci]|uniref:Trehalase n=1 Tax=Malassezia psittaci TaxID=1821823 RepID=A0AAF0JLJ4_9BASI|nr:alpha,alpha-trehalase [Malassezia psittaci]